MSIDLHIHSTMSDGTMSPTEIVALASKKGLKSVSITDHDTIAGVKEASAAGETYNVEVLSGVEFSVKHGGLSIHLLGYMFDPDNEDLSLSLKKLQRGRRERNEKIVDKLSQQGILIDMEVLKKISGPEQMGRPHFAGYLLKTGIVKTMDEAFEKYLGQNGSAYVSRFIYELNEAIDVLHKAGGLSFLAHPLSLSQNPIEFAASVNEMIAFGLDGIEAFYPTHSKKYRKQLVQLASEKGLLLSGGSDYHGAIRPGTTLAGGKNVYVPFRLVEEMKQTHSKRFNNSGEV